jgi:hypothetical protein
MDAKSTQSLICTIHNSVPNDHLSVPCAQKATSRLKFTDLITGGNIPNVSFGFSGQNPISTEFLHNVEFFLQFVKQATL